MASWLPLLPWSPCSPAPLPLPPPPPRSPVAGAGAVEEKSVEPEVGWLWPSQGSRYLHPAGQLCDRWLGAVTVWRVANVAARPKTARPPLDAPAETARPSPQHTRGNAHPAPQTKLWRWPVALRCSSGSKVLLSSSVV